jgi:serine/threonine protein kinase
VTKRLPGCAKQKSGPIFPQLVTLCGNSWRAAAWALVYLAQDQVLDRRVAIKILDSADLDGALAERLNKEARVLARLEHPGIVPVHDAGTLSDGHVFM